MKTYNILKNGFSIGQATGKNKAIQYLKRYIGENPSIWGDFKAGRLNVQSMNEIYTITENKGDIC